MQQVQGDECGQPAGGNSTGHWSVSIRTIYPRQSALNSDNLPAAVSKHFTTIASRLLVRVDQSLLASAYIKVKLWNNRHMVSDICFTSVFVSAPMQIFILVTRMKGGGEG